MTHTILRFTIVESFDSFMALRDHWNALCNRCDVDHAFMRHEWFECWIRNLGKAHRLQILTAWLGRRMIGAAPLGISTQARKRLPLRILGFLSSSVSPRCNFLIDPDLNPTEFFDAVLDLKGWDIMELRSVQKDLSTTQRLLEYLRLNTSFLVESGIQSPYETLTTDWQSFYSSRSKGFKKNIRNSQNRLQKAASHAFVTLDTKDMFCRHMDDLLTVSRNSWKAKEHTDLANNPNMWSFYKELAHVGFPEALCRAYVLYIEDKPAGFDFYLLHKRRLVGIRWEYDEAFSYYMPGLSVHRYVIERLLAADEVWEYDLAGMDTEYKTGLVKLLRPHLDITVARSNVKSWMLLFGKRLLMSKSDSLVSGLSEESPDV